MNDLDNELGVKPDEDGTDGVPRAMCRHDEMSREYRDPVNFSLLSAGVVIGGISLVIYWRSGILFSGAWPFALIFPLVGMLVAYRALKVAQPSGSTVLAGGTDAKSLVAPRPTGGDAVVRGENR